MQGLEIMNDDPSEVDVLYIKVIQNKGIAKLKALCKEITSHLQKKGFLSNEEVKVGSVSQNAKMKQKLRKSPRTTQDDS